MTKIKVVDSIMGSGKTSGAINLMNSKMFEKYIFITPYLTEVERVKEGCTRRKFYEPNFQTVKGEKLTKFDSLHNLLLQRKNIASTHALFKRANEETIELIEAGNYTLILDEVMDVIEPIPLKKGDIEILFDHKYIIIDDDNYVHWNEDKKDHDSRYNDIKEMALNKSLIYYRDTFFMWTFPADVFKSFKEVYILTYLFDCQIQKYYYDMNGLSYEKYIATNKDGQYKFIPNVNHSDKEIKEQLKGKIHIFDDAKLNSIGDKETSLSKTWYTNRKESLKLLKNNTENFFKNKMKAKSNETMWTTFKDYQTKIKGRGYSKSFVPCNARATNEYRDRIYLAYTINRYLQPYITGFFHDKGIKVNENLFALSELIQWIWRSAIREGNEIYLYIPSNRMRNILLKWLDDDI